MELNIKYKTDMIKFLDLQKVTAKYAEEIHEAVLRVVDSGWYLQGKENAMFETHYSSYIGTKYTIGCANGLDVQKQDSTSPTRKQSMPLRLLLS